MKRSIVPVAVLIVIYVFVLMTVAEGMDMATEHVSMVTTPVFLLRGDKKISQGTGFYYQLETASNKFLFLVTNHHVLTGCSPEKELPPEGDSIIFYFHRDANNPGDVKQVQMPLFTKHKKPIWLNSKNTHMPILLWYLSQVIFGKTLRLLLLTKDGQSPVLR